MTHDSNRREDALDWLVRTNDPDFDRWDEFTAWLEASTANADAYHAIAASEAEMTALVKDLPTASRQVAERRRRPAAIAAGVAILAAAATGIVAPRLMPVDYATGPGEVRLVTLAGADQLVMNGDTKLSLAGWNRRTVRLEQGQLLLKLHEPDARGITVHSGDLELVDVGTVFEVARDGQFTRVLVGEGAVVADPDGARLRLAAGQRLDARDGDQVLRAMPSGGASAGSFERGQLAYTNEPVDHVIADLRRSTGIDFSAEDAISARSFTGTLSVAEVKRDPRSLEPLLGVSMVRSGQGWKLGGKV
ncbi:MAG: FecR domain-containing protein [Sphingomonas sp.]|nr:FecR domain-containing protein [Sphingomonas sp.]